MQRAYLILMYEDRKNVEEEVKSVRHPQDEDGCCQDKGRAFKQHPGKLRVTFRHLGQGQKLLSAGGDPS